MSVIINRPITSLSISNPYSFTEDARSSNDAPLISVEKITGVWKSFVTTIAVLWKSLFSKTSSIVDNGSESPRSLSSTDSTDGSITPLDRRGTPSSQTITPTGTPDPQPPAFIDLIHQNINNIREKSEDTLFAEVSTLFNTMFNENTPFLNTANNTIITFRQHWNDELQFNINKQKADNWKHQIAIDVPRAVEKLKIVVKKPDGFLEFSKEEDTHLCVNEDISDPLNYNAIVKNRLAVPENLEPLLAASIAQTVINIILPALLFDMYMETTGFLLNKELKYTEITVMPDGNTVQLSKVYERMVVNPREGEAPSKNKFFKISCTLRLNPNYRPNSEIQEEQNQMFLENVMATPIPYFS